MDVAQGPVVIEIPPGAIVGLLDDFWQRSLADVGLPGPDAGNGGKSYRLHVPANPPAVAFWSLTAYDSATRSMIQNPTNDALQPHCAAVRRHMGAA